MRTKMRSQLGSDKSADGSKAFHLKQDPGGIVDIEFMVQYAVLAWASEAPELTRYTDNIRILESLGNSGLLGTQEVSELTEAYKAFRSIGHSLTLQQQTSLIDGKLLVHERQTVRRIWQSLLAES
jgi:glutamate-ammonia-ligase adenylyltransferase